MPRIVFKILFTLLISAIAACGGSGGSSSNSTVAPPTPAGPVANPVVISGAITFDRVPQRVSGTGLDYNNIITDAARGVTVELVNNAGVVQSTTATDNFGEYQLQAPGNTNVRLQVKAQMLSTNAAAWNVRVADNTNGNALYVIQGSLTNSGELDSTRNLHAASGWNSATGGYTEPRSAAPLAILDVIYEAMQLFAAIDPTVNFPPLELRWSTANTTADGNLTDGDIGTSFYSAGAIYLVGGADNDTDEYDRHIIAHEWGHYVEDKLSRSDSIGGSHRSGDRLDMRVSFSEGFGYALAAIVLEDPIVRDSFGSRQSSGFSFDIERNQTFNPGWYSEASVQSILYDLADDESDGVDQIATGLAAIYDVMTSNTYRTSSALATLYLFVSEFNRQYPEHTDNVNALLNGQAVFGIDQWGTDESNNAGQETVLPVYAMGNLAARQTVCTISEFNSVLQSSVNKLGNSVFVRYPNITSGGYVINVERISGSVNTEPQLSLYRNGAYILDISNNPNGGIAWSGRLNAGDYVLVLSEADAMPGCYSLSFSNN